jgi:hypothetical protein
MAFTASLYVRMYRAPGCNRLSVAAGIEATRPALRAPAIEVIAPGKGNSMGIQEDRLVEYFYEKFKGRVAIGVGYAEGLVEVFPLVLEDGAGNTLGSLAMAALSNERVTSVHIFHLNAFTGRCGHGSAILQLLCRKADQFSVTLSLSPIPAPNGTPDQISGRQLTDWYATFGFKGDGLLSRPPQTG